MPSSNNAPHTYLVIRLAETSTDTTQPAAVQMYAIAQLKQYLEDVAASLPATAPAAAPENTKS